MPNQHNTGLIWQDLSFPFGTTPSDKGLWENSSQKKNIYRVSRSGNFYPPWAKTHMLDWFDTVSTFPLSSLIGSGQPEGRDKRFARALGEVGWVRGQLPWLPEVTQR